MPSTIKSLIEGKVRDGSVDAVEPSEFRIVWIEKDFVGARQFNPHAVICEALCGVEVEQKEKFSPLEGDHFVVLVFAADVSLQSK